LLVYLHAKNTTQTHTVAEGLIINHRHVYRAIGLKTIHYFSNKHVLRLTVMLMTIKQAHFSAKILITQFSFARIFVLILVDFQNQEFSNKKAFKIFIFELSEINFIRKL